MNKNGQIIGQVFVYIMAAIVIGAIIIIGYWAVKNITDKSCQVELITFKSKIENYAAKHSSYGSVNKEALIAPCGYAKVCFVDAGQIGNITGLSKCKNQVINASVKDGDMKNIFLVTSKTIIPIGYSEYISVADTTDCTCIENTNGNFFITFKGFNFRTELSTTGG
jgi:hypothetical protein